MTVDSDFKFACSVRCMDPAAVRDAGLRLDPDGVEKVSYRCHLSGRQEQILLPGDNLAARLVEAAAEIGDIYDARIVAGLYSAELCECDVATLTSLAEPETVSRLSALAAKGVLSHRKLDGMNYYRVESGTLRSKIAEIVSRSVTE